MDKNILSNIMDAYNGSRVSYEFFRYKSTHAKSPDEYDKYTSFALRNFQICEGLEIAIECYPEELYICYLETITYRGIKLTVLKYRIYEPDKTVDLSV